MGDVEPDDCTGSPSRDHGLPSIARRSYHDALARVDTQVIPAIDDLDILDDPPVEPDPLGTGAPEEGDQEQRQDPVR